MHTLPSAPIASPAVDIPVPGSDALGSDALGTRIRGLREANGMSLRALARTLDISASAVSQIERGQLRPSVNRLISIANALEVPLASVFESADEQAARVTPGNTEGPTDSGVVVARAGTIADIELEGGVVLRSLSPSDDPRVQFFESTYPPGARGSLHGDLIRHRGVEIGRVTQGELTIDFGSHRVLLRAGDSITYPCTVPHLLVNLSDGPTVATWLIADMQT